MKQFTLMFILTVGLAGCGKKSTQAEPEAKSKVAEKQPKVPQPEPGNTKPEAKAGEPKEAVEKPTPAKGFTNSLGMKFVPVLPRNLNEQPKLASPWLDALYCLGFLWIWIYWRKQRRTDFRTDRLRI